MPNIVLAWGWIWTSDLSDVDASWFGFPTWRRNDNEAIKVMGHVSNR
jgi:hypothetical protein